MDEEEKMIWSGPVRPGSWVGQSYIDIPRYSNSYAKEAQDAMREYLRLGMEYNLATGRTDENEQIQEEKTEM